MYNHEVCDESYFGLPRKGAGNCQHLGEFTDDKLPNKKKKRGNKTQHCFSTFGIITNSNVVTILQTMSIVESTGLQSGSLLELIIYQENLFTLGMGGGGGDH